MSLRILVIVLGGLLLLGCDSKSKSKKASLPPALQVGEPRGSPPSVLEKPAPKANLGPDVKVIFGTWKGELAKSGGRTLKGLPAAIAKVSTMKIDEKAIHMTFAGQDGDRTEIYPYVFEKKNGSLVTLDVKIAGQQKLWTLDVSVEGKVDVSEEGNPSTFQYALVDSTDEEKNDDEDAAAASGDAGPDAAPAAGEADAGKKAKTDDPKAKDDPKGKKGEPKDEKKTAPKKAEKKN